MNCIFCKSDSRESRSVEHVIPESLGNTEHTLPPGVVCDKCNNYFACKVEGPLLADPYFRELCFRTAVISKKGRAPRVRGVHMQSRVEVELSPNLDGSGMSVGAAFEKDERRWIESVRGSTTGKLIIPIPTVADQRLMSRFLAKVALECLALRLLDLPGGIDEIASKTGLDPLRDYARKGNAKLLWPFHARVLYAPEFIFAKSGQQPYEVLHEWIFLYPSESMLYLVIAIFGVEYALNLGEPEIETYKSWLIENADKSHLYPDGFDVL
jgi:hypothetical protein